MNVISPESTQISVSDFQKYVAGQKAYLSGLFKAMDKNRDNKVSLNEFLEFTKAANMRINLELVKALYTHTSALTLENFVRNLVLVPHPPPKPATPSDKLSLKYFYAGGIAGVVSRTCTAPFDRLKVFLITNKGRNISALNAAKEIYKLGGWTAFFRGNGLNVIKVLPDSAMKFGGFETAKRAIAKLENVEVSELSNFSTFIAGGLGGVLSQLVIYPIDTVKYRVQCDGKSLPFVLKNTYSQHGIKTFYRGLSVGLCGMFPFAALDLGCFSLLKSVYLKSTHTNSNRMGSVPVLCIGALSGSLGATAVYPINLVRTRIQSQQTLAHPYKYVNFRDCYRQTIMRDGYRGLFRGLGPNLAKVAPSVAISYLVYERAKRAMNLN